VRLGHRGALGITEPAQQLPALRVDDGQRVSEPPGRGRDQLEVELRQPGTGPAGAGDPAGDLLLAGGGQRVHLAFGPVRQSGRLLAGDQARLLQPAQGDVDLPGVHGVPGRAERLLQPGAELVPMRWLLGQHGQHDFLLHRLFSSNGYLYR
jgi:hypothetical protein